MCIPYVLIVQVFGFKGEFAIDLAQNLIGKTGGLSPEIGVHYVAQGRRQVLRMVVKWEMARVNATNELHAIMHILRLGHRKGITALKNDGTWRDMEPYRDFADEPDKEKMGIYLGTSSDYGASEPGVFLWDELMPGADVDVLRQRHPKDWRSRALIESPQNVCTQVQFMDSGIPNEGLAQDDFLMIVVQLSYLLAHGKLIEPAPLWAAICRELNKVGTSTLDRTSLWGIQDPLREIERYLLLPFQKPVRAAKMHIDAESVLLVGVPGVGKTVLEHYLMGSSYNAIFAAIDSNMLREDLSKSGENDGSKMLVRIDQIMKHTTLPVIPIIDDIDVILDKEEVVSKVLNMMKGIREKGLRIIASTNYLEKIDRRLLEPGRFSKIIYMPLPGLADRHGVLMTYLKRLPFRSDDLETFSRKMAGQTAGWSHRYLCELTVAAGRICVERDEDTLLPRHFDEFSLISPGGWNLPASRNGTKKFGKW